MASIDKQSGGSVTLLITGIISLVVGVAGGLILNYFTERKAGLQYAVVASEVFSGTTQNSAILAIETRNTGGKEVEDLKMQIALPNAKLVEYKIVGLPSAAFTATSQEKALTVDIPFFNPSEKVSVQLFVALAASNFDPPSIDVRAKGVTATQSETLTKDVNTKASTPILIGTAAMALAPGVLMFWLRKRRRYTTSHNDDQREVFAYILGINELYAEAEAARNSPRQLSYWGHADLITESCLRSGNQDETRKGIKALNDLMDYAAVAETSRMLINFDVARMSAAIGDLDAAKTHLKLALIVNHEVIKKRIAFDVKLAAIAKDLGYEIASA
jgi:hypothetical protein